MSETAATTQPGVIERELHIAARPETVFRFFVDPERMVRWMGRTAELDPTPGGRFRIDYNGSDIAVESWPIMTKEQVAAELIAHFAKNFAGA